MSTDVTYGRLETTDVDEIIAATAKAGRLRAISDPCQAIRETDLSFACVGTPSLVNLNLDLRYVRRICEQMAEALKNKNKRLTVVIRSTILPGRMRTIVIPLLEEFWGKKAGVDFGACNNPEFLIRRTLSFVNWMQPARHAGNALEETRRSVDQDGLRDG